MHSFVFNRYAKYIRCNFKKIPYLIIFLVFTMTFPACVVDDDVRCKYNQTKLGVVVAILPKTNKRDKTYFVKWDTSCHSVPVNRKCFIKHYNPEKYNKSILEIKKLAAKQEKNSQGEVILPVTLLKPNPTFEYRTPPEAILSSVEHKTQDVRNKIEIERQQTENQVPTIKVQTHQIENEVPLIKVCAEDLAEDIKSNSENYYEPANIANALVVVYKQFHCPVYSDYSRGHCYEIV